MKKEIIELFSNEEFVERLENTNAVEMRELFAEYGEEVTDEEVLEIIKEAVEDEHGEIPLCEEDLENVSGGTAIGLAIKALGWTWRWAVKVWGSPQKAVRGTINYWRKKFR